MDKRSHLELSVYIRTYMYTPKYMCIYMCVCDALRLILAGRVLTDYKKMDKRSHLEFVCLFIYIYIYVHVHITTHVHILTNICICGYIHMYRGIVGRVDTGK